MLIWCENGGRGRDAPNTQCFPGHLVLEQVEVDHLHAAVGVSNMQSTTGDIFSGGEPSVFRRRGHETNVALQ